MKQKSEFLRKYGTHKNRSLVVDKEYCMMLLLSKDSILWENVFFILMVFTVLK